MATKEISLVIRAKSMVAGAVAQAGAAMTKLKDAALGVGQKLAKWGAGTAAAMAVAAKRAEDLNKQLGQIQAISGISIEESKRLVMGLSASFGIAKDELTKGLYDALSAGVPKNNALEFMTVAAKTATAGAGTTAQAVDILTTALNAFRLPTSKAEQVADVLFETIRLGKTTLTELADGFAQVAPMAQASGVPIEQVAAAIATLTQQGTKTPAAMLQIRAALKALNDTLGDGWSKTMTFQQGVKKMADMAGGSTAELTKMTGRMEGALAILQLTGKNAETAANHLGAVTAATGSMSKAFEAADKQNVIGKIVQPLDNIVRLAGDRVLQEFGPTLQRAAEAMEALAQQTITAEGWLRTFSLSMRTFGAEVATSWDLLKSLADPRNMGRPDKLFGAWKNWFTEMRDLSRKEHAEWNEIGNEKVRGAKDTADAIVAAASEAGPIEIPVEIDDHDATEKWIAELKKDREDLYKAIDEFQDDMLKEEERLAQERVRLEKEANDQITEMRKKAHQNEIDRAEDELQKAEELAGKRVAQVIEEARAREKEEASRAKDADKARKIEDKLRRGVDASPRDRKFLAAFRQIEAAQGRIQPLQEQIGIAKENLEQLDQSNKTLTDILGELERIEAHQKELLAMG
jgi:hypothetical protein